MVTWRAAEAEKMTLFEYVTVAVSIVLSFGVVRLLDGLRAAALPECRYWVHLAWIPTKLLNHALYWWGLGRYVTPHPGTSPRSSGFFSFPRRSISSRPPW
jgi:hypothetical protein